MPFAVFVFCLSTYAQFKDIGPAPLAPAEAHLKIRELLDHVDAANRSQTVQTITGWLVWYRDIVDEEMIAEWKSERRRNLGLVMNELGDARIASEMAASWRQGLNLSEAPMVVNLMTRYPESARSFVRDLQGSPLLAPEEADAACRVLLDLPDQWRVETLRILPHYRAAAQALLTRDLGAGDEETVGRAQFWLRDLKWGVPGESAARQDAGRQDTPRRRTVNAPPEAPADASPARPRLNNPVSPAVPAPSAYNGARSGTLTCGRVIPQNAEFVFRDLPQAHVNLDYDSKLWSVRLTPGEGDTQRLIVRNISSGQQKNCVVHWTLAQ